MVVVWAILISPHTQYGDNWAIYPIFVLAFLILGWHIFLIVSPRETPRLTFILYDIIHLVVFAYIFMLALMLITKDSL